MHCLLGTFGISSRSLRSGVRVWRISAAVVEAGHHAGRSTAASRSPGTGSAFTVTLPTGPALEADAARDAVTSEQATM